jgi:hypothetical protein
MTKPKRSGKRKAISVDTDVNVVRLTRLEGGPIAEIWALVFRDERQNDYMATVTVPADPPAGAITSIEMLDKDYGGEPIATVTAEAASVPKLEQVAAVLNEIGYNCRVVKFFILPQAEMDLRAMNNRLHRLWDSDPQGKDDPRIRLYSRAVTALRELLDLEGGKDVRRHK